MLWDFIYLCCKLFFTFLWAVYLVSLLSGWDPGFMWHLTGIASTMYMLVNIRWYLTGGGRQSK